MDTYNVRQIESGLQISGGKLEEPLLYENAELSTLYHLIGFLSERSGATVRTYDANGELIAERLYAPGVPPGEHSMSSMLSGRGGLQQSRDEGHGK